MEGSVISSALPGTYNSSETRAPFHHSVTQHTTDAKAAECDECRPDLTSLLPVEIAVYMLRFLPMEDVAHMAQTNWYWANAARSEYRYVATLSVRDRNLSLQFCGAITCNCRATAFVSTFR
jgi:hypothetical protein